MELNMHHGGHGHGSGPGEGEALDPVCGMTVEIETATAKELHVAHAGVDYYFCGRGCKLEFGDDPQKYLDSSYMPSM